MYISPIKFKEAEMKKIFRSLLLGALLAFETTAVIIAAGGYTATKQFTLTVVAPLVISNVSPLPEAVAAQTYSVTFTASGGIPPYVWSVTTGSTLPAGLTLTSGGVLSGMPTTAGTYTFSITVTDGSNQKAQFKIVGQ
jgi:hypothetical protein